MCFRASTLLHELRNEEFLKLKNGRNWDHIQSGDSVQIERLPFSTAKDVEIVKGVVVAKTNRASDSMLTIANVSLMLIPLLLR